MAVFAVVALIFSKKANFAQFEGNHCAFLFILTYNSEILCKFAWKRLRPKTYINYKQKQTTMYSDPKECLYCTNNQTLHDLMIEIAHLRVSRVFLFKEQTYRGRCLVSYDKHVNDLNELTDEERNAFMADVAQTTRAMQKAFNPEKINYGAYSDKLSHLHFHLAPKYVDGPDYGGTFQMNPGKVYLSDAEYQELIEKVKANL